MQTVSDLFAVYKGFKGVETDEALARCLGVSKTALSNYKAGIRRLPDRAIVEIAEELGMETSQVMAIVNANLATPDAAEQEFWLARLPAFIACVGAAAVLSFTPVSNSHAKDGASGGRESNSYVNLLCGAGMNITTRPRPVPDQRPGELARRCSLSVRPQRSANAHADTSSPEVNHCSRAAPLATAAA